MAQLKRWLTISFVSFIHCLLIPSFEAAQECELKSNSGNTKFPENFKFGVSTAAYQIEGGWNEDGKGPSIWDTFTHNHPEMIADHSTGDVGPDSYHLFEKDLAALKELKVNFYRFSISWSRILPNGDLSSKNQKGIDYYNMIIDKLLENNIEPMVTMYHNDMPEELNKLGGFTNQSFISFFEIYAETLFKNFGDRVKIWITFNDPIEYCVPGYGNANSPPMVHAPGVADYLCMDITLKSHATVYQLYKSQFKLQGGKVGITLSSSFAYSKANDAQVVDRSMQFALGWLAYPIFGPSGNYPSIMLEDIASNSLKEGLSWSRLLPIADGWLQTIKGSADFLGLNYYYSHYVEWASPPEGEIPSWDYDAHLKYSVDPKWRRAKSSWLYCVPKGLEDILKWIRDNYNNVEVMITENGWSDDGQLDDNERIDHLKAHLQAVVNAIDDGCNVTHYTHWSLIENFEWKSGYTEKFGLFSVNVTSCDKDRIAKKSAYYYKKAIENKIVPASLGCATDHKHDNWFYFLFIYLTIGCVKKLFLFTSF